MSTRQHAHTRPTLVSTETMQISLAKGVGYGPTELSAFDAALLAAGIGNLNLIYLSSVLPPGAQVNRVDAIHLPHAEWGDRLYCVMAEARTSRPGHEVWSSIGWTYDASGRGLFVEHHAPSEDQVRDLVDSSLDGLCQSRGMEFPYRDIEVAGARCEDTAVSALVVASFESAGWHRP